MSESKTECPFCGRAPGDVHGRECPMASAKRGPSPAARALEANVQRVAANPVRELRRALAGEATPAAIRRARFRNARDAAQARAEAEPGP